MLEQQRIEYLQAMGIQLWMPRKALNYAAESSWLAESAESLARSEVVSGANFQAGHAADLLAGMGFHDAKPKIQTTVNVPDISSTPNSSLKTESVESFESSVSDVETVDLTVPDFELHFALWPCGILWVSSKPFDQTDHTFQTSVSYYLLENGVPQASYSQFKWPYIEGSSEDQGMAVALRALTAQWEFMSGQGARGWVSMDASSLQWITKVTAKPLFSVSNTETLYCSAGKKQLWQALQNLPLTSAS